MSEQPVPTPPPESLVTTTEPTRAQARADRARSGGYRSRFAMLYVALAVIAGIGIGALVVLITRPDAAPSPHWSAWEPSGSDSARTKQIADRVAKGYRLDNGQQLAIALSGPPTVTAGGTGGTGDIPVRAIVVRPDTTAGLAEEDDIDIVGSGGSHQYILCGLGTNCSIPSGKPSEARHALLRREAVELALYTFKYVPSVDTVTVFLPPRPDGAAPPNAVFLRRGDLKQELGDPLPKTLEPTTPTLSQLTGRELGTVNRLTRPHLYQYEYQQAQDGSAVLVLSPVVTAS